MSGPSQDVEVRLAEIDRRLREIQADLVPGRTPRETQMPSVRPPPERAAAPPPPPPESPTRTPRRAAAPPAGRSGPLAEALASARRRASEVAERPAAVDTDRPGPVGTERRASERREPAIRAPEPPEPATNEGLGILTSSLLAAMRDLLEGYEHAVSSARPARPFRVSVAVGPFSGTEALHAFERALARISGVREVSVSGYDGPDRAILEVQLEDDTPPGPKT
jgi:hypothetical protein